MIKICISQGKKNCTKLTSTKGKHDSHTYSPKNSCSVPLFEKLIDAFCSLNHILIVIIVLGNIIVQTVHGTGIACNRTADCDQLTILRKGSVCLDTGYCSNPFHNGGCLSRHYSEFNDTMLLAKRKHIRVCTSTDPPETEILGYCISPHDHFNYMEIRFAALNWESIFFETWIAQILLSEILGVPTSVETGHSDLVVDFYDKQSRFDYGDAYNWDAFRLANEVKDCRLIIQPVNSSEYKSCAHVGLEVWEGQQKNLQDLEEEEAIEKPSPLGALGHISWFIPKFTAERDPSLLSFLGLAGEKNRHKLAEMFKRPTKWIDYCEQVSSTNCSKPDEVATRAPENEDEASRMFVEGTYTGHFRKTEKNDCKSYPFNCTGHMADFPCGWDSFMKQQAFYLDIAVESDGDEPLSGGYSYSQLSEMWAAANATKSNVMMLWWTPEALYQTYLGTEAEFLRISLTPPTQHCYEHKVNPADRCSGKPELVYGTAAGACDDEPHPLVKVITKNMYESSYNTNVLKEQRSPAYDALKNFELSGLQLGVIFEKWLSINIDKWNLDPREATCQWVVENLGLIESFVPRTYPRILKDGENMFSQPLFYVALIVGVMSMLLILAVCVTTYKFRNRKAISISQVEFLSLILFGLVMVQIGSILMLIPPSNASCTMVAWLHNLGYTLELAPLLVKVSAINRLMSAARHMRRVKVDRKKLFAAVAGVTFGMAIYLMLWTILSPPQKTMKYELTIDVSEYGDTIVKSYSFCHSEQNFWALIALGWRSLLLLWATVLAFQSLNSPVNVNESKTLAVMVYSMFVFLLLSIILFFSTDFINVSQLPRFESLVQSLDVTMVCCIYFIPKLQLTDAKMKANFEMDGNRRLSSFITSSFAESSMHVSGSEHGTSFNHSSNQGKAAMQTANDEITARSLAAALSKIAAENSSFHDDSNPSFCEDISEEEIERNGLHFLSSLDARGETLTKADLESQSLSKEAVYIDHDFKTDGEGTRLSFTPGLADINAISSTEATVLVNKFAETDTKKPMGYQDSKEKDDETENINFDHLMRHIIGNPATLPSNRLQL